MRKHHVCIAIAKSSLVSVFLAIAGLTVRGLSKLRREAISRRIRRLSLGTICKMEPPSSITHTIFSDCEKGHPWEHIRANVGVRIDVYLIPNDAHRTEARFAHATAAPASAPSEEGSGVAEAAHDHEKHHEDTEEVHLEDVASTDRKSVV